MIKRFIAWLFRPEPLPTVYELQKRIVLYSELI